MEEQSPADDSVAEYTAALDDLMRHYGNLHRVDLVCLDPDEYFDRQLDRKPFKEPRDKSKQRAAKDAGITLGLRAKALIPWETESKAELEKRAGQAEVLQREYEKEHARNVEEERTSYQQQQERHNQQVTARRDSFLNGDPEEVMAYFDQVLCSDGFTLDRVEFCGVSPPEWESSRAKGNGRRPRI